MGARLRRELRLEPQEPGLAPIENHRGLGLHPADEIIVVREESGELEIP